MKSIYRSEDRNCAIKVMKFSMPVTWKRRCLSALLIVTLVSLMVVALPFASRWYQRIGSVELSGDRWTQIGSFDLDAQQIKAHFYRTSGRTDILLRVDYNNIDGDWIQGEKIPLGLTEETIIVLPDAEEYKLFAKWTDDDLFIRRAWIELTAS